MKCPRMKECGACQFIDTDYKITLENKTKEMQKLFNGLEVKPILGMDNPYHYRHKIYATFGYNKKKQLNAGIYQEGSHKLVFVENCLIQNEEANKIINDFCKIANKLHLQPYNEDYDKGVLRHLYLRVSNKTGDVLLVVVIGSKVLPGSKELFKQLRELHPSIKTIIVNHNNKPTSMILGDNEKVIIGKGSINDELCGIDFRISSHSFFQVNPTQTSILYQTALDKANITKSDVVLDAYCGIGTISLVAATKAKEVIGVDVNNANIKDAIQNAKNNKITNTKFFLKDVSQFMDDFTNADQHIDVALLDPPRSGCDKRFLVSLAKLKPDRIVYISCNPETQKRDLSYLKKCDYKIHDVQPVDMFPFTNHIETVAMLSRNK